MIRILFICHGNICRSAAAEMIMRDILRRNHMENAVHVSSAATSLEEIGNDVYPPMKSTLAAHRVPCHPHSARRMTQRDYEDNDILIGMDRENIRNMERIAGGDPGDKIHYLMEYAGKPGQEVSDPWYTRDFETAFQDILEGCEGLLSVLKHAFPIPGAGSSLSSS